MVSKTQKNPNSDQAHSFVCFFFGIHFFVFSFSEKEKRNERHFRSEHCIVSCCELCDYKRSTPISILTTADLLSTGLLVHPFHLPLSAVDSIEVQEKPIIPFIHTTKHTIQVDITIQ